MEYIGIGDLHLDKLDNLIEDVNAKIMKSIRRVLNYALENGVKYVLFYGDICDSTIMSYDAQCAFVETILAKKYRELDIHIIPG